MNPAFERTIKTPGGAIADAGKAVVVANLAMNLFFGSALAELFASIGKLSIMIHLFIADVKIPPNA